MRSLLLPCLLALVCSCVAVASMEPWAPLELRADPAGVHPLNEGFVYVDDVYRGNLVDGSFRIFLTLEPHDVRVEFPGRQPWEQSITLTEVEYPQGRTVVVAPSVEDGG